MRTQRLPGRTIEILSGRRGEWKTQLVRNHTGIPRPILSNCLVAIREAPEWKDVLGFNEFSLHVVALRSTPWGYVGSWTDIAELRATEWLQQHGIHVGPEVAGQAIQVVAQEHPFHPVRDWLTQLKWDGQRRIETWLTDYLGVADSTYSRAVSERWLLAAIARVFRPGVKVDSCLIAEGAQGIGKSAAFRTLGGEWFTDEIAELGTKDASLQLQGAWIIELAELDSLSKSEVGRIKAFMSRTSDRFRPPYGRRVIESPRQCVFAGTVNHRD